MATLRLGSRCGSTWRPPCTNSVYGSSTVCMLRPLLWVRRTTCCTNASVVVVVLVWPRAVVHALVREAWCSRDTLGARVCDRGAITRWHILLDMDVMSQPSPRTASCTQHCIRLGESDCVATRLPSVLGRLVQCLGQRGLPPGPLHRTRNYCRPHQLVQCTHMHTHTHTHTHTDTQRHTHTYKDPRLTQPG